jgi:hypothetical protein
VFSGDCLDWENGPDLREVGRLMRVLADLFGLGYASRSADDRVSEGITIQDAACLHFWCTSAAAVAPVRQPS